MQASKLTGTVFLGLIALSAPCAALTHSLSKRFGDFYGGLLHPLTSLELGLAFVVFALLAGQQGTQHARFALAWFMGTLTTGAIVALWLPSYAEELRLPSIAFTALFGVMVAIAPRLPAAILLLIGVIAGLLSGLSNGLAMTAETAAHMFVPGIAASGLLVVIPIAAFVTTLHRQWQLTSVRILGSWIAASGLLVMAFQLRGVMNPVIQS
jgi:hydrogenase/urease accessory protein HupE